MLLPIFIIWLIIFISAVSSEYREIDKSTIEIPNLGMLVTVDNNHYDEEDACYVLETRAEIVDEEKYKKIDLVNDTVSVTYSFADGNGYIVGDETMFIENLKHQKWKYEIKYCGRYAEDVVDYEVESVDNY